MSDLYVDYLVVGGGVAGVCCAEELSSLLADQRPGTADSRAVVGLVSGRSGYVKVVTNVERLTEMTTTFDVAETTADALAERIRVFQHDVCAWSAQERTVRLSDGSMIRFAKLCIATGARPKRALGASPTARAHILTLRDVESIARLREQISAGRCRRVLIVGNGGIATELAFELEGVEEIVWAIRHGAISSTFFDEAAARFFAPKLAAGRRAETAPKPESRLDRFTVYQRPQPRDGASTVVDVGYDGRPPQPKRCGSSKSDFDDGPATGCALGPHWLAKLGQRHDDPTSGERYVRVIHDARVRHVHAIGEATESPNANEDEKDDSWPVVVEFEPTSSDGVGERIGADFVVEATGVTPNSELWARNSAELKIAADGGICVDDMLRTAVPDVYSAGDVCTMENDSRSHWMQIRLWTQARQMGLFCARSMVVENLLPDICFDLFTHVTTFFGYKVVLLGDFLGAKLSPPYEVHYRISPSSSSRKEAKTEEGKPAGTEVNDPGEYVKVLTRDGRVHGAVLIGETDLEETMENLILDQTDITAIELQLLEPSIDLEDYFD